MAEKNMIRLVLADDHTVVREGMKLLLENQADMQVIGMAANGNEAYEMAGRLLPDILLLDISMPPGDSGIVTAGRIHTDYPGVRIIMMTMHEDREYLLYALKEGAQGYVLKNAPEQVLTEAIRTVFSGSRYISKEMVPYLVDGYLDGTQEESGLLSLSDREKEILVLTAKGFGNKEISEKLFLSVKTVESYKVRIMNKLDLKSRPEMVEYAMKKRLIEF